MTENIIYIRTSTDQQNPENQLADIHTIAPKDAKIYKEQQSAWKDHIITRPIFKEICDLIKTGNVSTFAVWDLDRIYRNRIKTVEFMQLCKHYNTTVISYRQTWLNELETIPQPWGDIVKDLLIQVLGWISEEESGKKSERVKIAYKNHKGKKWGRPKVDTNKFEILQLKNQGMSIRQIAQELNLSKSKVHSVLKTNPQKTPILYK